MQVVYFGIETPRQRILGGKRTKKGNTHTWTVWVTVDASILLALNLNAFFFFFLFAKNAAVSAMVNSGIGDSFKC